MINFLLLARINQCLKLFFLQTIFNSPIFILKKELLKIPIFGWYLKKIGSISIDRNKTTKSNHGFFDKIIQIINKSNRPLIIFPQGTRLNSEDRTPFKKGAARIYEELKIKCLPIAISSGNTWPKKGPLKPNLNIIISILEPIEPGLQKKIFLEKIQENIYSELNRLS